MNELLLVAKAALQLNAEIIGPEQLNFQNMLEKKYQELLSKFQVISKKMHF
jgi:hypothetical protein